MTSRERLTRLFNNEDIDRIPIWLLNPVHRLGCYTDFFSNPVYQDVAGYVNRYADNLDRRSYSFGHFRNGNPDIVTERIREGDQRNGRSGTRIRYKDFVLESYIETVNGQRHKKYYLDDIDQLEQILEIPYIEKNPDISSYRREKEELGDRGLMMTDIGDPLAILYNLMDASDFSIATLTDYDKLLTFTDEMYRRVLKNYKYLLENDIGEVFFIVGAEFAGPPLVSPDKFNELSVRYVKGIVDLIREYGKKSIVHYHGNLYHVLKGMKEINPDGLHTIEAPPIGDCTIAQAREVLGNMILIGNLQYDDLRSMSADEIDEAVKNMIEEAKDGRFILSTTAGPYENHPSQAILDNYIQFIKSGVKYGSKK